MTLGSIGYAVLTTDTAGRITFLNPVAEALTGWSLQDALASRARWCSVSSMSRPASRWRVRWRGCSGTASPSVWRRQTVLDHPGRPRCPGGRPVCPDPARGRAAARRRGGLSRRVGPPPVGSADAARGRRSGTRDLGRGDGTRLQQYPRADPRLCRTGPGRCAAGQSCTYPD